MKKGGFIALIGLLLVPAVASSWNFDYSIISEGGILGPSPHYIGIFTSGAEGTFEIWFDDTGWPTDPEERFDSLWVWYFAANYDSTPGAANWKGTIPGRFYMNTTAAPPGYVGWCEGTIQAKITVRDFNENRTLELWERNKQHLFDGRLSKLCDDPSGGEMACKWGWGAVASNYFSFVSPPGPDTLYDGGNLTLMEGCPSATEPTSWGSIKALYR